MTGLSSSSHNTDQMQASCSSDRSPRYGHVFKVRYQGKSRGVPSDSESASASRAGVLSTLPRPFFTGSLLDGWCEELEPETRSVPEWLMLREHDHLIWHVSSVWSLSFSCTLSFSAEDSSLSTQVNTVVCCGFAPRTALFSALFQAPPMIHNRHLVSTFSYLRVSSRTLNIHGDH